MSTNKKKFLTKYGLPDDTSLSLQDMSNLSGLPLEALQLVFNRGTGAWKTNPESVRVKTTFGKVPSAPRQSRLSKEQWSYARVYAFLMKTPKVYYGADDDIRKAFGLE